METVQVKIQEVSAKLSLPTGEVEIFFRPLKKNVLGKLQLDLDKAKKKAEEGLFEESKQLVDDYELLPFKQILRVEGELLDFGESVSEEDLKTGNISAPLFKAITELFWKYVTALNPKEETDPKKESVGEGSQQG